jgi:hypothetical protein
MECAELTDDELWRAIAENTNALSLVAEQRQELDAAIAASYNAAGRASLMRLHLATVNRFHREYRAYTAELRRRHALCEQSPPDKWMQTLSDSLPAKIGFGTRHA